MRAGFAWMMVVVAGTLAASSWTGCTAVERTIGAGGSASSSSGSPAASSASSASSSSAGTGGLGGGSSSSASGVSSTSTAASSSSSSGQGTGGGASSSASSSSGAASSSGAPCISNSCADPACTALGFACAPAVPNGWAGPVVLYAGAGAPPACGPEWGAQTAGGILPLTAPPATCGACSCGTPTGLGCGAVATSVELSSATTCLGSISNTTTGNCTSASVSGLRSVHALAPAATGGACAPSGGAPTKMLPAFGTQAALCAPLANGGATGCSAGTCLPTPPSGYGASACVYRAGDVACPTTSSFTLKTLIYESVSDTRGCTTCACGAPTGATCTGIVDIYSYNVFGLCNTALFASVAADGACHVLASSPSLPFDFAVRTALPASGGACAESGGAPNGTATPIQPVTVCCE